MSLINVLNLTFAYSGSYDNIFENISFQIDTDWKLGFIGRNGRGKTTFLNLLLGKYKYNGKILADVDFDYFPYEVENKHFNTIDIIDSFVHDFEVWKLIKELNLLDVSNDVLYQPFDTLSNGEQTKVLLATLFLKENNFLLIDEPTNHLDVNGRKIVSNYLNSKKGFILVSHDRVFIDNCIDHILSINRTNIKIQKGNFSSWWYNKQLQDNFELTKNEKLKKDIKRLNSAAKKTSEWSNSAEKRKIGFDPKKTEKNLNRRASEGAKSKKMMSRSKSIESRQKTAIEDTFKLLKNIENSDNLKIIPLKYHSNNLVEIKDVSIFYGDKLACNNVSFTVSQGERIALYGKNGSGKSSILKLICGEQVSYQGTMKKGSQLKISYVCQDTSNIYGNISDYAFDNKIDESLFKSILHKLGFTKTQFNKDIANFSGGQKKKVLIAKSLCEQAHLYIWDEPLNYIDVISRIQIEELLIQYKPTILFVEHDIAFCNKISTNIIRL